VAFSQWWQDRVLPQLLKGRGAGLEGLVDPFDKQREHTLKRNLIRGKLDWLLVDQDAFVVRHRAVGTGKQSDHFWISVDLGKQESLENNLN